MWRSTRMTMSCSALMSIRTKQNYVPCIHEKAWKRMSVIPHLPRANATARSDLNRHHQFLQSAHASRLIVANCLRLGIRQDISVSHWATLTQTICLVHQMRWKRLQWVRAVRLRNCLPRGCCPLRLQSGVLKVMGHRLWGQLRRLRRLPKQAWSRLRRCWIMWRSCRYRSWRMRWKNSR